MAESWLQLSKKPRQLGKAQPRLGPRWDKLIHSTHERGAGAPLLFASSTMATVSLLWLYQAISLNPLKLAKIVHQAVAKLD